MGKRRMGNSSQRKKIKLSKRSSELRKKEAKGKAKYRHDSAKAKANEARAKAAQAKAALRRLFSPELRTLLVGEGDFSFTRALVRMWERERIEATDGGSQRDVEDLVGFRLVATCLDSKEELVEKYPDVKDVVREIKAQGGTVHCGIDATQLLDSKRVVRSLGELADEAEDQGEEIDFGFDRIVFNFPHLGCGVKDTLQNNEQHRDMLQRFFLSAHSVLAEEGQVLVTAKCGEPYDSWRIPHIAVQTGLFKVHSSVPFLPANFDGYQHRRTLGAPTKELTPNADIASAKAESRTLVFVKSTFKSRKAHRAAASDDESSDDGDKGGNKVAAKPKDLKL